MVDSRRFHGRGAAKVRVMSRDRGTSLGHWFHSMFTSTAGLLYISVRTFRAYCKIDVIKFL